MYVFRKGYYADVRTERRYASTIAYKNGVLAENKERTVVGAFIRVFDGKMWYYASTETLADVQKELDGLYELAEYNEAIDENPVVSRLEVNRDQKFLFAEENVEKTPREEKQKLLTDLFPVVAARQEVKFAQLVYLDRHSDFGFYSSKGAEIGYDYIRPAAWRRRFSPQTGRRIFLSIFRKRARNSGRSTVLESRSKRVSKRASRF